MVKSLAKYLLFEELLAVLKYRGMVHRLRWGNGKLKFSRTLKSVFIRIDESCIFVYNYPPNIIKKRVAVSILENAYDLAIDKFISKNEPSYIKRKKGV